MVPHYVLIDSSANYFPRPVHITISPPNAHGRFGFVQIIRENGAAHQNRNPSAISWNRPHYFGQVDQVVLDQLQRHLFQYQRTLLLRHCLQLVNRLIHIHVSRSFVHLPPARKRFERRLLHFDVEKHSVRKLYRQFGNSF